MYKTSVIIPTYNRGYCLEKAILSVLQQTYPVHEVIIVDDHSTDNTASIVSAINDPRVKYHYLPQNRGAGGARNFGVSMASGEFIAFHDSDDEWLPEKLEHQINYYIEHQIYGLIYCSYESTLPNDYRYTFPMLDSSTTLEGHIFSNLLIKNTIGTPTILVRKDIFEQVGGFDESMSALEDWEFALKIARKYPIGFLPEVQVIVTPSPNSLESSYGNFYKNRCYLIYKYKQELIELNLLESTLKTIIEEASKDNVLQLVEKLLTIYLTK